MCETPGGYFFLKKKIKLMAASLGMKIEVRRNCDDDGLEGIVAGMLTWERKMRGRGCVFAWAWVSTGPQ